MRRGRSPAAYRAFCSLLLLSALLPGSWTSPADAQDQRSSRGWSNETGDATPGWTDRDWAKAENRQGYIDKDWFDMSTEESRYVAWSVQTFHLGTTFWKNYNSGRYYYAIGDLKYCLWVFPNHEKALHLLGVICRTTREYQLPITYFEKALAKFPQHAKTHAQFGAYLVSIGEYDRGIAKLQQALAMEPDLLFAQGWLQTARAEMEKKAASPAEASKPSGG
jgi:tetratricopeptide (TPR) repeat protein